MLSRNYLLSGVTDIDGEWSDAGFNADWKNYLIKAYLTGGEEKGYKKLYIDNISPPSLTPSKV